MSTTISSVSALPLDVELGLFAVRLRVHAPLEAVGRGHDHVATRNELKVNSACNEDQNGSYHAVVRSTKV